MKKQAQLQAAIIEANTTASEVSEKTGVPRAYISQAIHGRFILNDEEKKQIAEALNRNPEELFK